MHKIPVYNCVRWCKPTSEASVEENRGKGKPNKSMEVIREDMRDENMIRDRENTTNWPLLRGIRAKIKQVQIRKYA